MDRSAVILAAPLKEDKVVPQRDGKPLIEYVIDVINEAVDEIIVVAQSQQDADAYGKVLAPDIKIIVNTDEDKGSLAAAAAGFEAAQGEYSLVLPSGSIYISGEVVSLLLDCAVGKAAVVPRWTDQRIEALHAVYHTKETLKAAKEAVAQGDYELDAVVERLRGVRYMSTMVIEQLDPEFKTFYIQTASVDSSKAAAMGKSKPKKAGKLKS